MGIFDSIGGKIFGGSSGYTLALGLGVYHCLIQYMTKLCSYLLLWMKGMDLLYSKAGCT